MTQFPFICCAVFKGTQQRFYILLCSTSNAIVSFSGWIFNTHSIHAWKGTLFSRLGSRENVFSAKNTCGHINDLPDYMVSNFYISWCFTTVSHSFVEKKTIEEEQKGLKLNSKRNIIGQIRNIHGWKGNKSSLLGMIEKEQNGLKRNYHF